MERSDHGFSDDEAKSIEITIPQYLQEIKLSDSRRKKYFMRGDEKIPDKYLTQKGGTILREPYTWKENKVYNSETKAYPIRNSQSFDKPRWKTIAGNDIWGGVNKHYQQKVTVALKKQFAEFLPEELNLRFPVKIDCTVYCNPRLGNWDIGNLWLYAKIFEDAMQIKGILPEDHIGYVTKSGNGPRYIPIVNDEERRMVFTITEDRDPRILGHVLYNLYTKKKILQMHVVRYNIKHDLYTMVFTSEGEPGTVFLDDVRTIMFVSIGKSKILYPKVKNGIRSCFSLAIQYNVELLISKLDYERFGNFVDREVLDRGLQVYLHE